MIRKHVRPLLLLLFVAACGISAEPEDEARGKQSSAIEEGPTTIPNNMIKPQPPTSLGLDGFTANARIQPGGKPTTYYYEYGKTTEYGSSTPTRALPPRLTAHYQESWSSGAGGWGAGVQSNDLEAVPTGGFRDGFVRSTDRGAYSDDWNHLAGIGDVHLMQYMFPGHYDPRVAQGTLPSAQLGGGDPDLRDAKINLYVRGNGWQSHPEELVFWVQADLDVAARYRPTWQRTNWAYTGGPSFIGNLASGQWENIAYQLKNDTNYWTYAGTLNDQAKYTYWSLDNALAHATTDFFHALVFVRMEQYPQGSIDLDEFSISYRNHSLLAPSNGGRLVKAPLVGDASLLTDGWRNGVSRSWRVKKEPKGPALTPPYEFEYAFDQPITLKAIQIHNDAMCPSKDVAVSITEDGTTYLPFATWTLPASSPHGPNFLFHLQRKTDNGDNFVALHDVPLRGAKVRVLSSYNASCFGLGEIEMFGDGARMLTEDDWYNVNQDITQLDPGGTYHYRLAVTTDGVTTFGPDETISLPNGVGPLVVTGPVSRLGPSTAVVTGRINALNRYTYWRVEYGETTSYGKLAFYWSVPYYVKTDTPVSVSIELDGLVPGTTYHYRVTAYNETGMTSGEDKTFVAQ